MSTQRASQFTRNVQHQFTAGVACRFEGAQGRQLPAAPRYPLDDHRRYWWNSP